LKKTPNKWPVRFNLASASCSIEKATRNQFWWLFSCPDIVTSSQQIDCLLASLMLFLPNIQDVASIVASIQ
ncbi:MAG: hypothetical protein KDA69_09940, partial [Planctomycetaceae bacterium]|nr:hypothetical protein [Planctomycetaceae bacterium]